MSDKDTAKFTGCGGHFYSNDPEEIKRYLEGQMIFAGAFIIMCFAIPFVVWLT